MKFKWIVFVLAIPLFYMFVVPALAQEDVIPEKAQQDYCGSNVLDKLKKSVKKDNPKTKTSEYFPKVACSDIDDIPTREVCWNAYRASLDYYETGLSHRTKVIRWQHISTKIIFGVVLTLVFAGLYFAWVQFNSGQAVYPKSKTEKDESKPSLVPPEQANHSVEINTSGIKVSSPVLGVIILTLSLAFFYLYLIYVYPITEIF